MIGDGEILQLAGALVDDVEGLRRTSATLQERIRRVRRVEIGRLFARLSQPVRELARKEGKEVTLRSPAKRPRSTRRWSSASPSRCCTFCATRWPTASSRRRCAPRSASRAPGTVTLTARASRRRRRDRRRRRRRRASISPACAARSSPPAASTPKPPPRSTSRRSTPRSSSPASRRASPPTTSPAAASASTPCATRSRACTAPSASRRRRAAAPRFIVRLPLTTVVQEALLFKVGGQVYAVPAARVDEIVEVTPADVELGDVERAASRHASRCRWCASARCSACRRRPGAASAAPRSSSTPATTSSSPSPATRSSARARSSCAASARCSPSLPLYAGATISGAGKVQLILDVGAPRRGRAPRRARTTARRAPTACRACSSSTTRAPSARRRCSSWRRAATPPTPSPTAGTRGSCLQDRPFHALVTDLEMPRLDGWELIARVRRSPELAALPIIVVSSRAAATRVRVLAAGADAVVDKPLASQGAPRRVDGAVSERARSTAAPRMMR